MDIDTLITFFGWCSLINIAVLVLSMLVLLIFRKPIAQIHSRLFGLEPEALPPVYMHYIGSYKLLILMFNLVPYVSLQLIRI